MSWSKPQWVDIHGKKTRTSIIHTPADVIHVTQDGIEENETAAHEGQVYAFFTHHYEYWRKRLGISTAWDWCHWGENITFKTDTSLNETNMNLGDKWRVGDDVVLQICGARVPCFKLSWRCGQKDKWLKELADSGFSGVYLKVLVGGAIRPGDRAVLLEKQRNSATVASITKVAFNNNLQTKDTLDLLVREPHLLSMNKIFLLHKLSILHDQALINKNHWKSWRTCRVVEIRNESKGIKSFYLKPTDGLPLGTYVPGQFLPIRLPNGLTRLWSISDWPNHDNPSFYRLSIKEAGEGSKWMHSECKVSSKVFIRAPCGQFNLDWTPIFAGRQVYVSAGIGITPIVSMLKAHLTHFSMRKAPAVWIHVVKDEDEFTRGLLEEVLTLYDDDLRRKKLLLIHLFFTRQQQKPESASYGDIDVHYGCRPTLSTFSSLLSATYFVDPLKITPFELPGPVSTCYICGPAAFEDSVKEHLRAIGVPEGMIKSESFASAVGTVPPSNIERASVKFALSKVTADWEAGENPALSKSLLDLAEMAGLDPNYGCRAGACGACKVKLLNGSVTGGMLPGGVLVCVARPTSQTLELDM